jgi:hypothetical protein
VATTFKLYWDSGLTDEVTSLDPIYAVQKSDGSSPPGQFHLYLGSTVSAKKIQADSNPGVDQITFSISDSGVGTGEPSSAVKLALTEGGLATAVAGAALDIGTQRLSGVVNALSIWVEVEDQVGDVGIYTDLEIITNLTVETAA